MESTETNLKAALEMISVFASVGAEQFDLTHTNIQEEKRGFRPKQTLSQIRESLPYLIPSSFRRQNNVIVRPHSPQADLIQLDDLKPADLDRVKSAAFLVIETSQGNFQAWVAAAGKPDKELARRLRKGTGADPSASGATRVAGSANYKQKYAPNFPIVAIRSAQPGRTVTPAELESLGLLAQADPPRPALLKPKRSARSPKWPSYTRCLADAPFSNDGEKRDISRADFTWCLISIDWGHTVEETAARLMEQSAKARENGQGYADMTAQNAATAIAEREKTPSNFEKFSP
jgi:hypothetical protein